MLAFEVGWSQHPGGYLWCQLLVSAVSAFGCCWVLARLPWLVRLLLLLLVLAWKALLGLGRKACWLPGSLSQPAPGSNITCTDGTLAAIQTQLVCVCGTDPALPADPFLGVMATGHSKHVCRGECTCRLPLPLAPANQRRPLFPWKVVLLGWLVVGPCRKGPSCKGRNMEKGEWRAFLSGDVVSQPHHSVSLT